MDKPKFSYSQAIHWLGNYFIRMPEILMPHITARFDEFNENDEPIEIYQYFLTDCSEEDAEFLEKSFGLLFYEYPEEEFFILAVPHWGTSWDMIEWVDNVENEYIKDKINNGQL